MTETKQINCRIPYELHLALANHKARTGEEKSEVVRRGIEMALGLREPVAELASNMKALRQARAQNQATTLALIEKHSPSAVARPDERARLGSPDLDAAQPEDREGGDSGSSKPSPEGIASESRPSRVKDSDQVPDAPSGGSSIDLAVWLSGRTGIPQALCRRYVKAGRVAVDGRVYREPTAPADYLLLPVTLDGNRV